MKSERGRAVEGFLGKTGPRRGLPQRPWEAGPDGHGGASLAGYASGRVLAAKFFASLLADKPVYKIGCSRSV